MEISFKRYVAMIIFVLVCVAVSIPLLNSDFSASGSSNLPPPIIIVPSEDENPSTNEDGQEIVVPAFKNAYDAFAYGNNLIRNGKGYELHYYSVSDATVFGIKQKQYLFSEAMRNGERKFEYVVGTCDISLGENSYRYQYQEKNGGEVQRRITKNINKKDAASIKDVQPIWTDEPEITYEYDYYLENICSVGFDFLCFNNTRDNAKDDYFRSDAKYYTFCFSLDVTKLPEKYLKNYKLGAGATAISFNSVSVEYVMNKKTGKFVSATKKENYNMDARGVSLAIDCTTKYTFKKINETVEFSKPAVN